MDLLELLTGLYLRKYMELGPKGLHVFHRDVIVRFKKKLILNGDQIIFKENWVIWRRMTHLHYPFSLITT